MANGKYEELWLYKVVATVDPLNPKRALIGLILRYRFDLNIMKDWVKAGEFVTNDIYLDPTTKKQTVSHVQRADLQQLNDIIDVSNQTKIDNQTGQKLLDPFDNAKVLKYAHANALLVSPTDDVFFVGKLN